jgi:hypothetical protein
LSASFCLFFLDLGCVPVLFAGRAVLHASLKNSPPVSGVTGEVERPASVSSVSPEQSKPSYLTGEEFFSEAWRTARPANRTETKPRQRKKRHSEADNRQHSIFPSEDEQRELIAELDNPPVKTFSAEKYREESLERLRKQYSSYRAYRTDGEESQIRGIAVARKHDGSALVLNPIGGEITDFAASDIAG